MPFGEAARRIGIDHFDVSGFGNADVFVHAAVGESDFQADVFVNVVYNRSIGGSFAVFGQTLRDRFGVDADQKVVGFDDVFAVFFGLFEARVVALEFVGVAFFHRIAVNGFEFFQGYRFLYIEQLSVLDNFLHKYCFRLNHMRQARF